MTNLRTHTFADEGDDSAVAQQVEQIVITEPIGGNASSDPHQQQHYVAASGSSGGGARTVRNLRGHDSGMNLRHQQHDTSTHEMFAAEQIVVSGVTCACVMRACVQVEEVLSQGTTARTTRRARGRAAKQAESNMLDDMP